MYFGCLYVDESLFLFVVVVFFVRFVGVWFSFFFFWLIVWVFFEIDVFVCNVIWFKFLEWFWVFEYVKLFVDFFLDLFFFVLEYNFLMFFFWIRIIDFCFCVLFWFEIVFVFIVFLFCELYVNIFVGVCFLIDGFLLLIL